MKLVSSLYLILQETESLLMNCRRQGEHETHAWISPKIIHFKVFWNKNQINSYTINSINEWVVAAVTHGEPVEDEEHDVDVLPGVDSGMDDGGEEVGLPGRPAQREHHNHHEHHVQNLLGEEGQHVDINIMM